MINVTANTEVLKTGIEQSSATKQGNTMVELGYLVKTLSPQNHDVSIHLGDSPGLVGLTHDLAWNGFTIVQGDFKVAEQKFDKHLSMMVDK
jgi:hypothetical protein